MNRGQLIEAVRFALGNMATDDPAYVRLPIHVTTGIEQVILLGVNHDRVSRDRLSMFPELEETFIVGPSVVNQAYVDFPANALAISAVFSYDKATTPNPSLDQGRSLGSKIPYARFTTLPKSAGDYPRQWSARKRQVWFHPYPDTAHLTQFEMHGWKRDRNFVTETDNALAPYVAEQWHPASVQMACYFAAVELGWGADAQTYYNAAEKMVSNSLDPGALSNEDVSECIEIEGWLTRDEVYG